MADAPARVGHAQMFVKELAELGTAIERALRAAKIVTILVPEELSCDARMLQFLSEPIVVGHRIILLLCMLRRGQQLRMTESPSAVSVCHSKIE